MLDLNRLYLLHELSVLGTISRVAVARGLTRPAVSHQLLQLEADLGAVLFERSGRGVQLTATGRRLVSLSRELFDVAERIESDIEAASGRIAGEVRLAAFGSAASGLVPKVLKELAVRHPHVDIHFSELESQEGMRAAAAKQVDLAVVYELVDSPTMPNSLQLLPLCVDTFAVVVSARHRLARRKQLTLADLARERWDVNTVSTGYYSLIRSACQAQGFEPQIRSSCRNPTASLRLIAESSLIAVFPTLSLDGARHDKTLSVIPLVPPLTRRIFVATVRDSSRRPLIAAVIDVLRDVLEEG
jgi:DNA-binding transcriptional LysR family regulator